jgi:hypothetical protein
MFPNMKCSLDKNVYHDTGFFIIQIVEIYKIKNKQYGRVAIKIIIKIHTVHFTIMVQKKRL